MSQYWTFKIPKPFKRDSENGGTQYWSISQQDDPDEQQSTETDEEYLLRQIRDEFEHFSDYWSDIRKERQVDLRYICGQPWDPADYKARQELGRPAISHDELTQYVNSTVNNARTNPRGIKVEPAGQGANAQTADFRQQMIRGIEYRSKATQAYLKAYQDMVEGSYGYIRIGRKYSNQDVDGPDDQEITIGAVTNPDTVLYDPNCKTPDWSDAKKVFVLDLLTRDEFREQYPDAKIKDFGWHHFEVAGRWFTDKTVLVCEYWRVESKFVWNRKHTRKVEQKTVKQYITNGVEILEENEQPGEHIPIIPFIGLERWIHNSTMAGGGGGQAKRILFSLVRLARDPQMSLAYLVSQQMEEAGLSPKTPYIGYVGQFETDLNNWRAAGKQPFPFLQVDPMPDGGMGQILPLPQRTPFTPNFQGYEVAKDSCRRAIQAAMGITPLPTAAQRSNEKSGVALERIQTQEAIGSYHFTDGFDRALEYAGRIINDWIPVVYDTERDIALRKPNETHEIARINTEMPYYDGQTGMQRHHVIADQGDHDVTVSVGPSYQSQREEAADFVNTLIQNLTTLPLAPPQMQKLLAIGIRLRQLGPMGDELAEIVDPSTPGQAQQAQQQIGQMQGQLQQAQMLIQALQQELQKLQLEKQGKLVDNQARMAIERMKIEAQLAVAEINTRAQALSERAGFINDLYSQLHGQQHEAQQFAADRAHERMMQLQDQAHEQTMQGADQAHEFGMGQAEAAAQPPEQPATPA